MNYKLSTRRDENVERSEEREKVEVKDFPAVQWEIEKFILKKLDELFSVYFKNGIRFAGNEFPLQI